MKKYYDKLKISFTFLGDDVLSSASTVVDVGAFLEGENESIFE